MKRNSFRFTLLAKVMGRRASLGISVMLAAITLTGCSSDDNPVESQPTMEPTAEMMGIDVGAWDGLAVLQEALVTTDSLGNFVSRNVGKSLDEADTTVVSIGVKTVEEARQMFERWLSDDTEVQEWAPNTLTAYLTDEEGQKQGEVYFTPSGAPDELASVTFSDDLDIRHVSEVRFIPEQLWPNNAAAKSPYKLLQVVEESEQMPSKTWKSQWGVLKTHYIYYNESITRIVPKVCIREATSSVKGILVWAGEACFAHYFDDKDFIRQWATYSQVKEVANILNAKKNDKQWLSYNYTGYKLRGTGDLPVILEDEYWFNGRTMYIVTFGCKTFTLKNKWTKYYDTTFWGTKDLVGFIEDYPSPANYRPLYVEYFEAE